MAGLAPSSIRDPGLQGERTALAWNRTAAGLLLNALLALRTGIVGDSAPVVVLSLAIMLVAAGTFFFARVRRRALIRPSGTIAVSSRALLGVTAAVLAATLAGLGAIWI